MELKYATVSTVLDASNSFAEVGNNVRGATVTSTVSTDILNELGEQDWELISQITFTNQDGSTIIISSVFSRRV